MSVPYDYANRDRVMSITWSDFHGLCRALAAAAARTEPEGVLAMLRGGVYAGALIAHMLRLPLFPVCFSRRDGDSVVSDHPRAVIEPPVAVAGRHVLLVDDICDTGETMHAARESALAAGAAGVKTAVLYAHSWTRFTPDFIGIRTDALILNPWDREVHEAGEFRLHPEYVEALREQGYEAGPEFLLSGEAVTPAKDG